MDPPRAILLFGEADALFGRRSEISDSDDRYANIEVGQLLKTTFPNSTLLCASVLSPRRVSRPRECSVVPEAAVTDALDRDICAAGARHT